MYSYSMPNQDKQEAELLTLQQAAALLNCHPNTLRSWDKRGYLRAIRLGTRGDRRYRKEDVMKLLEKNEKKD
jgi:putative resolvase